MEATGGELHGGHAAEHMAQPGSAVLQTPAEGCVGDIGNAPVTAMPVPDAGVIGQQVAADTRPRSIRGVEAAGYDSAKAIDRIRDIALSLLRENEGSFHITELLEIRTGKAHPGRRRQAGIVEKLGVIADMGTVKHQGKGQYVGEIPEPEPAAEPVVTTQHEEEAVETAPETYRRLSLDEMIASSGIRRSRPQNPGSGPRQRYSHKPTKNKRR